MILKTDLHFSIDLITDILSYFFMGDFKYKKNYDFENRDLLTFFNRFNLEKCVFMQSLSLYNLILELVNWCSISKDNLYYYTLSSISFALSTFN